METFIRFVDSRIFVDIFSFNLFSCARDKQVFFHVSAASFAHRRRVNLVAHLLYSLVSIRDSIETRMNRGNSLSLSPFQMLINLYCYSFACFQLSHVCVC